MSKQVSIPIDPPPHPPLTYLISTFLSLQFPSTQICDFFFYQDIYVIVIIGTGGDIFSEKMSSSNFSYFELKL